MRRAVAIAGIKGGAVVTVGNGRTIIERVQDAGPGTVNIPTEKINELGNLVSVGTIRDTPDLTFAYTSWDVSTDTEALISGQYGGRKVTDAVTQAGSPDVSSATADFTTADIGRMIVVDGAGQNGGDFVSTILSVTDGQNVVAADNAVGAVTAKELLVITNGFDLSVASPLDIASQFDGGKEADDPFGVVASVAMPFLYLDNMSYIFGLKTNAEQKGSLRGDTIFYNPGPTFTEEFDGTGVAGQTYPTVHPAYQSGEGDHRRVLSVEVGSTRLALGADYTETYGAVTAGAAITTLTFLKAIPTAQKVRIMYSSPDAVEYLQDVHSSALLKPAAIRGRDIEIYIGGYNPNDRLGSQVNRFSGAQQVQVDWKVNLEKDEELGNYYAVAQDFEIPNVTGKIDFKPRNPQDLLNRLRQAAGLTDATKAIGTATSEPIPIDVVIRNPLTGKTAKRINVPDARLTIPGFSAKVLTKTTWSFPITSDEGLLLVYPR